jgi:type I restriction enzyme S subunit
MSFPRYPAYKPSGVEWLGEVPEHWEVEKLKNIASFAGGGTPSRENLDYWGGPIPWVSPKDMKAEKIAQAEEGITQEGLDGSTSSLIAPGHVLLVVRSGILRHTIPVAINVVEVALNQDMKAIRLSDDICSSSFLFRWIQGFNDQLLHAWGKQGATVESIEQDYLSKSLVPLPPLAEQLAIATFLDHETAKIDALIAEQQRLIELLQEKRQAVISHAVTKGLNPDAPMKDSGVEWLGEVPEHWEVGPLKHHWLVTDCKHVTAEFRQEGYPLASIKEAQGRWIDLTNAKRTTEEFYNLLTEGSRTPEPGDLVFTRNATVGEVAEVPAQIESFALGQDVVILKKLNGSHCSSFAWHLLRSTAVSNQLECAMIGSTFRRINVEQIKAISVPIPPSHEQASMAIYLEEVTDQWAEQEQDARHCVSLLQERRSALISAAVTGQIDVRGLVPEASAA